MKTSCPTCGAEVEFRYDDSFVRVCAHCRAAVVRTDRGADTLGRFADLAPFDSPLALFAEGKLGAETFLLVGMAQIRQASGGISQEWYARFDGRWGWLAEGQGRYYLTFEVPETQPPPYDTLQPGAQYVLANRTYTVAERGEATYVAATGELPFRLAVNATYRFVDLSDGEGGFATIDFSDGSEPPTIYAGRQVTLAELAMSGGETAAPAAPIRSKKLDCPSCGAPIELHADRTLRVVCGHCSGLVDLEGQVPTLLRTVKRAKPLLPLGKTGAFADGTMTIIGYIGRSAKIGKDWYPFDEYLLYAPAVGFRWLVCSDGHWSYVQPIAQGAVTRDGGRVAYDGVTFRPYQRATQLRVDTVLGEAYWPVTVGEVVTGEDFIAPPAMLSCEVSVHEETWSLATYMTAPEVARAFRDKDLLVLPPLGVGANQPYPFTHLPLFAGIGFLALMTVAIVAGTRAKHASRYTTTVTIPPVHAPAAATRPKGEPPLDPAALDEYMARQQQPAPAEPTEEPAPATFFSEPFELQGGQNVEIVFSASGLANNWAYVAADLVEVATGTTLSFDDNLEYYSGSEDGEAWTEGSRDTDHVLAPVPGGQYVLRLEMQQGGPTALGLQVGIAQGVFRWRWFLIALGVLGLPYAGFALHHWSFNRRRWANSSDGIVLAEIAAASDSDD